MRVTQFSNLLSVLATQSSKLLNINGQHGCSNTELYLCSSVSTAQSEISSVLQNITALQQTFHRQHLQFVYSRLKTLIKCTGSSHSARSKILPENSVRF